MSKRTTVIPFRPPASTSDRLQRFFKRTMLILFMGVIGYQFTPFHRLQTLTISGNERIPTAELLMRLNLSHGSSLQLFNVEQQAQLLERHPLIENATLTKTPFGRLAIDLQEAEIVGCVQQGDAVHTLTAQGELYPPHLMPNLICDARKIEDLSQLTGATRLDLLADALSHLPASLVEQLHLIRFQPDYGDDNRYALYLKSGHILYVNAYTMKEKLLFFDELLAAVMTQYPETKGIFHLDVGDYYEVVEEAPREPEQGI